jgi:hypothetical protein
MSDIETLDGAGRPIALTEEILKIARDYVDTFKDPYEMRKEAKVIPGKGVEYVDVEKPRSIPSIAGLARRIKVYRSTIYRWYDKRYSEKFCYILEELNSIQEEYLLLHGCTGGYNAGFAKFVATNKTNLREKIEHDVTTREIKVEIPAEAIDI